MENKKTSVFSNTLIWFGAGVSIAEILTGTYFAPLGFRKGIEAILIGHLIGGILMFLAGYIGANKSMSAMQTVKGSFGYEGGKLFAVLNVLQLVGWTAIMIYDGAISAAEIWKIPLAVWAALIGALIVLWLVIGVTNLGKLNIFAIGALFALTVILSKIVFSARSEGIVSGEAMSFGAAVELAAVMPISWLPVISDYTRYSKKPFASTLASVTVYNAVSIWMYIIGMGAAIYTGQSDIAQLMIKAGMGVLGLAIIVLSTVTTTFLDAFSAAVSLKSIKESVNPGHFGIAVTVLGTAAAMIYPMDNIANFLYLIGSVFAPMISVLIADYFILKRDYMSSKINLTNLCVWFIGFCFYRYLLRLDSSLGASLPCMAFTLLLAVIIGKITTLKRS